MIKYKKIMKEIKLNVFLKGRDSEDKTKFEGTFLDYSDELLPDSDVLVCDYCPINKSLCRCDLLIKEEYFKLEDFSPRLDNGKLSLAYWCGNYAVEENKLEYICNAIPTKETIMKLFENDPEVQKELEKAYNEWGE